MAWHGPDLWRFNPTLSNEAQGDQSQAAINSCRNRRLYNPLVRIQRYCLGENRGLFQPMRRESQLLGNQLHY